MLHGLCRFFNLIVTITLSDRFCYRPPFDKETALRSKLICPKSYTESQYYGVRWSDSRTSSLTSTVKIKSVHWMNVT